MAPQYAITYPRRVILRFFLRLLGRFLMSVLARPTINGMENLPKSGPLILVGNHVAIIEVLMMALYVPWPIEMIGTGDIPVDPRFAWVVQLWGFIPVTRGSVDRNELKVPLDVIKQNGVIGIFPEGGIWSTTMKRARTGVAWLSYRTNAPVVPIGFGGMRGALQAALAFKRPRLVMNIGETLPPVDVKIEGKSRKQALDDAANTIMSHVEMLIPEAEKQDWQQIQDERFDFSLIIQTDQGETEQTVAHAQGLGRFFHTPVILDVMARNMHLPVKPLQQIDRAHDPADIATALAVALSFFDNHPHFLSYRFGYDRAEAMVAGVVELRDLARQLAANGQPIRLKPIRRYHDRTSGTEITEIIPGVMHKM